MKQGVVELLSFLKENKIKIALASSNVSRVVTKELTDLTEIILPSLIDVKEWFETNFYYE